MPKNRRSLLLLASQSPRRRQILSFLSIPFNVVKPKIDETPRKGESARHLVQRLALDKARWVSVRKPMYPVLAADTIVSLRGRIYGKPKDKSDAETMLKSLEGQTHSVYTGVALVWAERQVSLCHVEETRVHFGKIPEKALKAYLKSSEPYDKAGAYAIQGTAGKWIKKWEGDYFNVMGLPVQWVLRQLALLQP